jgi:hypothetical protein
VGNDDDKVNCVFSGILSDAISRFACYHFQLDSYTQYSHPEILDDKRWKSYKMGAEKVTKL